MPEPLEQLFAYIHSPDAHLRGSGLQGLLIHSQKNPAVHERALPIFRDALLTANDSWSLLSAVNGIELIAGDEEARAAKLELLKRPEANIVANIAMSMKDPQDVPVLIELLQSHPDQFVKTSTMRTLGRLQDHSAFEPIARYLSDVELRPTVVQSLGDLGDPRAIPLLQPLLGDATDLWPEDNHGPMVRMCDLAQSALKQLGEGGRAEPLPPPTLSPAPVASAVRVPPAPRAPYSPKSPEPFNFSVYLPLAMLLISFPWFMLVVIVTLYLYGKIPEDHGVGRRLDVFMMFPSIAGVSLAIHALSKKHATKWYEYACLVVGLIGCLLVMAVFLHDMIDKLK